MGSEMEDDDEEEQVKGIGILKTLRGMSLVEG